VHIDRCRCGLIFLRHPVSDDVQTAVVRRRPVMGAETSSGVATQNYHGEWVPAIPGPFFGVRKVCRCGRKFWTMEGYEGHYAYAHVLGMVPPPGGSS
jgi:hypothetical protein